MNLLIDCSELTVTLYGLTSSFPDFLLSTALTEESRGRLCWEGRWTQLTSKQLTIQLRSKRGLCCSRGVFETMYHVVLSRTRTLASLAFIILRPYSQTCISSFEILHKKNWTLLLLFIGFIYVRKKHKCIWNANHMIVEQMYECIIVDACCSYS